MWYNLQDNVHKTTSKWKYDVKDFISTNIISLDVEHSLSKYAPTFSANYRCFN